MVFVSGPYLLTPEFSFLHSFLSVSGFRFQVSGFSTGDLGVLTANQFPLCPGYAVQIPPRLSFSFRN